MGSGGGKASAPSKDGGNRRGGLRGPRKRLFLFSLWYFPSHFGLHVADVARAFRQAGFEVVIVTLAEEAFDLPYFAPFRDTFAPRVRDPPGVIRLNVERIEERGAYNPLVFLREDGALEACRGSIAEAPAYLLHYFEMLLPYFNRTLFPSACGCAVMYAGNFVERISTQEGAASVPPRQSDRLTRRLFARSLVPCPDGGFRLLGTQCILSETRALIRALHTTGLRTPSYWVSRPIFPESVLAAEPTDLHAEFAIPEDGKILLYAGRPAKNAVALPSILALVQGRCANTPIFLLLLGTPPEEVAAWPMAATQRERIRACRFADRARVYGAMKAADVLVYPGLIDGYPKVVSEAGVARLPVVAFASPASGLREMGGHAEIALIISVASPRATSAAENERFAAATWRVLSEREVRDALVARAFRAALRMDARHFVARMARHWCTARAHPAGRARPPPSRVE